MVTKDMTGAEVLDMAKKAREAGGPGINETIKMTPRIPHGLSRKQLIRDGQVAKELIYFSDVDQNRRLLVGAFMEHRHRLSDQRYWEFLRLVWIRAGSIELIPTFKTLLSSKRPFRFWIMSPEEEAELAALPDPFTAWRAPRPGGDEGISWSVEKSFVEEYAKANGREVIERTIPKSLVSAYFNRRGEGEVLILEEV